MTRSDKFSLLTTASDPVVHMWTAAELNRIGLDGWVLVCKYVLCHGCRARTRKLIKVETKLILVRIRTGRTWKKKSVELYDCIEVASDSTFPALFLFIAMNIRSCLVVSLRGRWSRGIDTVWSLRSLVHCSESQVFPRVDWTKMHAHQSVYYMRHRSGSYRVHYLQWVYTRLTYLKPLVSRRRTGSQEVFVKWRHASVTHKATTRVGTNRHVISLPEPLAADSRRCPANSVPIEYNLNSEPLHVQRLPRFLDPKGYNKWLSSRSTVSATISVDNFIQHTPKRREETAAEVGQIINASATVTIVLLLWFIRLNFVWKRLSVNGKTSAHSSS